MFKGMMGKEPTVSENYIKSFKENFSPVPGFKGSYKISAEKKVIFIKVDGAEAVYSTEASEKADVEITVSDETLQEIVAGRMTFQRAFMAGNMKMKGDFKILRTLDELYTFMK